MIVRLRAVLAAVVALVVVTAAAACGGGGGDAQSAPPPEVPVELVPASLVGGTLTLSEDDQAQKAFSELSDRALVADGRLWQVRQGDRLVATLQVTTMKTKVDLTDDGQRRSIVRHILPGTRQEIDVAGVPVAVSDTGDKTVFVWFGRELLQVLQVKTTTLDPAAILDDLVGYQTKSPAWKALPPSEDDAGA